MSSVKKISLAVALGLATISAPAQAAGVQIGQLSCIVDGGIGFIFGSSKQLNCTFTPADAASSQETYTGSVDKYGLDIGFTRESAILWAVVAAENHKSKAGQLAGTYSGATASATVAVGLGANVLVGGNADSIALQPVSISGSTGLNAAVGFAQIKLK